ncbi:glycosyltransferase [Staphylococcus sp. IVB6227]|uniref:glycosyltransferase n=1 Tax=Staphylococcus sp. IVB6227 TaxID=2989768 RepID=UPI0021D1BED6|nr:glycosyltransferase [Staphylococcus sp. IVB6227]UXR78203.1 CDP-glycerol glycerophosphotransferase family protein [Staphylococcus sp. IVB6227]
MALNYNELSLKGKFVVHADRKLQFLMEPLKSYYGINNISIIMDYAKYYEKLPVQENRILYQSRDGKSMSDSPYAIFKYLMSNPEYKDFIHVWACESNEIRKYYKKKYSHLEQVVFVVIHGDEYLKELAQCKYLINNSSFSIYFCSKPEQVYINTWHGTPLKYLGLDLDNSILAIQNLTRNFLHTKYFLTQNEHTTNVFKKGFQLDGLYDGEFVEDGYPRTDLTINTPYDEVKEDLISNNKNIKFKKEKTLLFAPTYRGNFMDPSDDIDELLDNVKLLEKNVDYNILLKVHPFMYSNVVEDSRFKKYLIPDSLDPNEVLCLADLLVTDYSSIFFDFLVTDKPIIFFTSDYEKYKEERGLYIDVNTLPGPTTTNIDDLITTINNAIYKEEKYLDLYKQFKKQYVPHDDGRVTERVVNKIFSTPVKQSNNKERILIYAGGLMNNGITSSLLNLLQNIDYNRFEVTIFLQRRANKIALDNMSKVNKNVKILLRSGGFFATFIENYRNNYVRKRGIITLKESLLYPDKAYRREFRRLFGNSRFDYVIDFSGYSMFWSNLILATPSKKKFIYLHSDMMEDLHKVVGNKKPHIINLKSLMTIYPKFDNLINVSENIHQINKKKLKRFNIDNKFVTVNNLLDLNRIYEGAKKEENIIKTLDPNKQLLIGNSPTGVEIINFDNNNFNIFASGRLSPEKGFDNLIEAFSYIANDYPNAMLYILGEGKDRTKLETMIHSRGLSERVYLLGHQSNPFSLINKADLFVLSSHYEGQGLVVLEALALGKNVLSSELEVTKEILENGKYGMLKNNDARSLADGIELFLKEETPIYEKYNVQKYNDIALTQFNNLFD